MDLGDRIRTARRLKRWSQTRLARELGVTPSAVGHWESCCRHAPATSRMARLAEILDVSFEWLTTGRGPMKFNGGAPTVVNPPIPITPDEEALLARFRRQSSRAQSALLEYLRFSAPPPRSD